MRTSLLRASLVLALASLVAGIATAQTAEPDRYVVVTYLKTLPGQDEAYRAPVTSVSKNVYKDVQGGRHPRRGAREGHARRPRGQRSSRRRTRAGTTGPVSTTCGTPSCRIAASCR